MINPFFKNMVLYNNNLLQLLISIHKKILILKLMIKDLVTAKKMT